MQLRKGDLNKAFTTSQCSFCGRGESCLKKLHLISGYLFKLCRNLAVTGTEKSLWTQTRVQDSYQACYCFMFLSLNIASNILSCAFLAECMNILSLESSSGIRDWQTSDVSLPRGWAVQKWNRDEGLLTKSLRSFTGRWGSLWLKSHAWFGNVLVWDTS